MKKKLHAAILLSLLMVVPRVIWGASPEDQFNLERLKSGQNLYLEKRYLDAIAQLHVAAFGYLSKPPSLSECLVWLTLAETAAGRAADADATIARFLEVERRFPSYPAASLPPEIRADFRRLLERRVDPAVLASMPSLAPVVETREQKFAKLLPAERKKALEAQARAEPASAKWPAALSQEALDEGDLKSADRWATKALTIEGNNPDALAVRARAREARGEYAGALSDLAAMAPGELEKRPELQAVRFVCLVGTGDWAGADDAAKRVPQGLAGRADVADAQLKLTAELQRRSSQAAASAKPAPRTASSSVPASATARPAPALPPPPAPTKAPAPGSSSGDATARSEAVLAESRRLVLSGKAGDAERILTDAVKADPGNRDLRLALLEAACLTRSYKTGLAQIAVLEPFGEVEAPSMFYAAVVLYDSGHPKEARTYLERSAKKVSGPLVDEYSKKILGPN